MAFAAVLAAVRAAFAFGWFRRDKCTLLSSKWMSTRSSLSSSLFTCIIIRLLALWSLLHAFVGDCMWTRLYL